MHPLTKIKALVVLVGGVAGLMLDALFGAGKLGWVLGFVVGIVIGSCFAYFIEQNDEPSR